MTSPITEQLGYPLVHYHQVTDTDTAEDLSAWLDQYHQYPHDLFQTAEDGSLLAYDGITHSMPVTPGTFIVASPLLLGIRFLTEEEFQRDVAPTP
jgi:hypothetical protein